MKLILTIIISLATTICTAQVRLSEKDLANLISIAEAYSQNPNASGEDFVKTINSHRSPRLNQIADTLIVVGEGDRSILENRFLARPSDDDLLLWYVIREVHYNRTSETKTSKTSADVANEILSKKIDSRWLLDNYYYRIHGGIALLFNSADLSKYDFNLDNMGFKDTTERSIFFLNMIDSMVGGRFKVLQMMKNNQRILEFSDKLPKFNGKEYYRYKDFGYDDFSWIGYQKTESYNERHIGMFYSVLLAHVTAVSQLRNKDAGREIYFNSILTEPGYFKFSESKDELQQLYDSAQPN